MDWIAEVQDREPRLPNSPWTLTVNGEVVQYVPLTIAERDELVKLARAATKGE